MVKFSTLMLTLPKTMSYVHLISKSCGQQIHKSISSSFVVLVNFCPVRFSMKIEYFCRQQGLLPNIEKHSEQDYTSSRFNIDQTNIPRRVYVFRTYFEYIPFKFLFFFSSNKLRVFGKYKEIFQNKDIGLVYTNKYEKKSF